RAYPTPEQAAALADVVLTMLPTADAVKEVMLAPRTLKAIRAGAAWAQMGTIGVVATGGLKAALAATRPDVNFVDSPVTGSREPVAGGTLASGAAMAKLAKMEGGDYSPDFSLEWALKDLDLAEAAAGAGVMPVANAIAERWRRLVAEGYGRLDISAARMGLGS